MGIKKQNRLSKYFENNQKNLIHKWLHYFDIYDQYFHKYRKKKVVILEFGVSHGGSLQMWRDYFGKKAIIYGVDIDERCKKFEADNTEIFIGDQEDRAFLKEIIRKVGPIDIVIEDGGHTMKQQIATFEEVYPAVKDTGIFLIEDLHTSYWSEYGGGYKKNGTFIEYAKELTDKLNAWHSRSKNLEVDYFTKSTKAIHFYDSIVVFEKSSIIKPSHKQIGKESL